MYKKRTVVRETIAEEIFKIRDKVNELGTIAFLAANVSYEPARDFSNISKE